MGVHGGTTKVTMLGERTTKGLTALAPTTTKHVVVAFPSTRALLGLRSGFNVRPPCDVFLCCCAFPAARTERALEINA